MWNMVNQFLVKVDDLVWGVPLMVLILAGGILLTARLGLLQMRRLPLALKWMFKNEEEGDGEISSFAALCTALSATIGTGNIVGVATAVCAGGPGALFWMIVAAFFGMATKYAEGLLAVKYRVVAEDGHSLGGPFYYIERGMGAKWKWLAKIFAFFGVCVGLFGIGTFSQVNGISSAIQNFFDPNKTNCVTLPFLGTYSWAVVIASLILAFCVGAILIGGLKRIATVSQIIVPFMAIAYILVALFILFNHMTAIPALIGHIFSNAFGIEQVVGGGLGATIMQGVRRGLFSNEAGMGSAPNAAATATVSHPVKQGLIQALSVFTDTIVICSCTAFIILLSDLPLDGTLKGIQLTQAAVGHEIGPFGAQFIAFCILLFAFSSIVGNYSYCETNLFFISRHPAGLQIYRIAVGGMVFFGSVAGLDIVWNLADLFMALMTLINLIALIFLGHLALKALKNYNDQKRRGIKSPVSKASDIPEIEDQLSEWK